MDGVKVVRSGCSVARIPVMYEPSIVIVAQGRKRGYLGDQRFVYDANHYLTLTVPLPFECETEVTEDGPFLGFAVRIDLALLSELMMKVGNGSRTPIATPQESSVTATPIDAELSDAAIRLLECMQSAVDASVLGPQIQREIIYRVLRGRRGGALQSLMQVDATQMQVHRVLHRMHSEYARPFDIATAAIDAGMSVSALHHHFKALTATSPLQYLKAVRLHKARMLMVQESVGAAIAAERVGYESASQFSREFKRLFGTSPVQETERLRSMFGIADANELSRSDASVGTRLAS
jgi:AraC-like DNA-binding protein